MYFDHQFLLSSTQSPSVIQWSLPLPGVMKLNVNGAVFLDRTKTDVGRVLQDAQGRVAMAATKLEEFLDDPLAVELLAIFRGLQFCVPLSILDLVVESDSLLTIQALQEEEESYILRFTRAGSPFSLL